VKQILYRKKKKESTNFLFKKLPNQIEIRGRVEQATLCINQHFIFTFLN
jgi:hypothetical protein